MDQDVTTPGRQRTRARRRIHRPWFPPSSPQDFSVPSVPPWSVHSCFPYRQGREISLPGPSLPELPPVDAEAWAGRPEGGGHGIVSEHRLVARRQPGEPDADRLQDRLLAGPAAEEREL